MKKTENVTIYQCDYCNKKYFRKHACEKHEIFCESNPENQKACTFCVHLIDEDIDIFHYDNYYGTEQKTTSKSFRCSKLDKKIYPTKVERLGLPEKYPETFEEQEPMPKECEFAKYVELIKIL